MNAIEKANVIWYHRECLRLEKEGFRKLGWTDLTSQQARFKVLCDIAPLNNKVIMDVGCGTGDLKTYLDANFQEFIYLGIDHVPEFIVQALERFKDVRNTFFKVADFTTDGLPDVDYILASGSLNYQTDNLLFPYRMIEKMYNSVKEGMAFNLLDDEKISPTDFLKPYNREEVLEFCLSLTSNVQVVTGYLPEDFTIMMYR